MSHVAVALFTKQFTNVLYYVRMVKFGELQEDCDVKIGSILEMAVPCPTGSSME